MAADTTALSYWLNWRVFLCALIFVVPMVMAVILIWKYEGVKRRGRHERQDNQQEQPGTLYEDEAWNTCLRGIDPVWLLSFRVFSFAAMSALLLANVISNGGGMFYFYTQWTFTLVTFYFGYGSSLSIYRCCINNMDYNSINENPTSIDTAEQGTYRPPAIDEASNTFKASDIHNKAPIRKTAGLCVYIFQMVFQTCAGAVVLTDIVFWLIIYPFTEGYRLTFLDVCMHSINAVFLLGDMALNSLRFPLFRIAYFALWSSIFVTYQWIIHACKNLWWPYQFLDLSSKYAPLWYLGVALIHIPCYGAFALIFKLKNSLLRKFHHESY